MEPTKRMRRKRTEGTPLPLLGRLLHPLRMSLLKQCQILMRILLCSAAMSETVCIASTHQHEKGENHVDIF